MQTNLTTPFILCRDIARHWISQGKRGKIINVASVGSFQGGINVSGYAGSKGGLLQLTRAFSNEWAGKGINVNAIAPGYIETDMTADTLAEQQHAAYRESIIPRIPVGSRCLPTFWRCQAHLKSAKDLLGPVIRDMISEDDKGTWSPKATEDEFNVLAWLVQAAKGSDLDPDTLAHVQVLLALASVHTILRRVVNVLYDLIENPKYIDELRDEIYNVWATTGWNNAADSFSKLYKLDSLPHGPEKRWFTKGPGRSSILNSREEVFDFGYGKTSCPGRHFASPIIKMVFVKLLTAYEFRVLLGHSRPKNYEAHKFIFPWPWDRIEFRTRKDRACPF
ncbi:2-deoxy-D-gluconate 3-dehydrogenase [Aspergillus luchuensis]|uniref:2-deoxy-D-gluconate 3-dehydrogenase n=1 Tax=Aspergillus kawachii TaxID=1069201 RepID=A0A146FG68_ASPKA|nr:2-deoxy-D-gluconate 3-dehydrogenase [Aspergillus luchuensis]